MISLDATLIVQFINFFLLIALLNVLLYRPLRRLLDERRGTIAGGHARAADLAQEIDAKMTAYQQRLQEAKQQAAGERAAMKAAAQAEEAKLMGEARKAATVIIQETVGRIGAEAEAARSALKKETESVAAQVAARVLGRTL